MKNAQVRFLISFDRVQAVASVLGGQLPSLQETFSVNALAERGRNARAPEVEPAEICFIQYTSGSTGDPKGVTLTHGNVLANIRGIGFAVEVRPTDTVVSWLPLYHDMGLIGSWLFSLYYGLPITVLSPLDFLVRPERWLWALSDSAGSLCPAPNFAFELCVRKVTDQAMEGVDLSPWRVAINAGEPVLPATLKRFTERFRPWGFDERSLMPFYGLAESSVALTYPPFWRGPVVDTSTGPPTKPRPSPCRQPRADQARCWNSYRTGGRCQSTKSRSWQITARSCRIARGTGPVSRPVKDQWLFPQPGSDGGGTGR